MTDLEWMTRALTLAARGRGLTSPNPMVGAIVVRDGALVAQRFHERAGAAHAEAAALAGAGERARGATLYVTLEPCNHVGRTPPCVEAIIRAGIRRVVSATRDSNPRVQGGGAATLIAAGIEVATPCLERDARALNRTFFTAVERQRPHVTAKWAMTLDGKIAAFDRHSQWITGEAARLEGHRLRSQSDAIVTGIGTVLADDPALTVRLLDPWPREPYRVVVDSRARLP
ncbi:MAG: bifunctional diaminohydroxyphosphoribosylaminopyrimidine deaminase/5-amino-6-(5-phosphoribosylamino)uracil reductase RibD, partial [Candidatus Rokuibacteriota bacterium]